MPRTSASLLISVGTLIKRVPLGAVLRHLVSLLGLFFALYFVFVALQPGARVRLHVSSSR